MRKWKHYKGGEYVEVANRVKQVVSISELARFVCLVRDEPNPEFIIPVFYDKGQYVALVRMAQVLREYVAYRKPDEEVGWLRERNDFHAKLPPRGEYRFVEVDKPTDAEMVKQLEDCGVFWQLQEDGTYAINSDDDPDTYSGDAADLYAAWRGIAA